MSGFRSKKIPTDALPRSDADRLDWIRLIRSRRVGPVTFIRLIREHGSAAAALEALPDVAAASGEENYEPFGHENALAEFTAAKATGARLLCLGEADYPEMLSAIDDPPPVLWMLGDQAIFNRPAVALVGARSASSAGLRMARRLASDLSDAGYAVVSGLARGIDGAAHASALKGGTIAVQAGGVDNIYPQENTDIANAILEHGTRLSEMPMGLQPQARHFPRRNRIISGLSAAVVVIEGAARSGSLITARDALDQGREVMAVPGSPLDGRSAGCNMLIRDGATLIRSAEDIIEVIQKVEPEPDADPLPADTLAEDLSERIMEMMSVTPVPEDQLIRMLGCPTRHITSALSLLELEQRIVREPGGLALA